MATDQQTEANRTNAQNSTGPRTEEGKARSSMNALKSGIYAQSTIIHGEDAADLEELTAQFYEHCQPATPFECVQVDTLIRCAWRARRLDRGESEHWDFNIYGSWTKTNNPLGKALSQGSHAFLRVDRLIGANERSFRQATAELERLQSNRRAQEEKEAKAAAAAAPPDPEPAPPPQPVKSETTYSEIGFVPQTPSSAPSIKVPEVASGGKVGFYPTPKGGRR